MRIGYERDQAAFENRPAPVRKYRGTVKLHGTNAGVTWPAGQPLVFQSRNRILKIGDDNAGFAATFDSPINQFWLKLAMAQIANHNKVSARTEMTVFGEWCGQGIQKNVAISELPKMFVIFAAYADDRWLDVDVTIGSPEGVVPIYSIYQFPTFEVEIDFASPELAQNELVRITEEVERECPVGKAFGVSGVGEGVVWTPVGNNDSKYWFKVKGEKHSSSKVAKLAEVDVERFRARDDLVTAMVTESRCEQALEHLTNDLGLDLKIQNVGHYLRWVFNDIIKEESDTIEANGFSQKELGKPISDVAKRYFMKALDRELAA